jgi:hypothetical protein
VKVVLMHPESSLRTESGPIPVRGFNQAKDPVRSALTTLAKELIWRYGIRFSPSKKPICLYGSRRSGSSLLMQMISVNRGVMFSDQPFGLYTASSANINRLPLFSYGQIANPDDEELVILRDYIEGLLAGSIRANLPWKFWSRDFHFSNDRICLKITDAKAMLDWIDQNFDVHTVVLTRHPIAQALSVTANQWLITGKGFLRNPTFVERWLPNDLETYCWDVYRGGTDLERRVLDWALENLPMLTWLPQRPHWLYLGYEDLIAQTAGVIDYLSDTLQLADRVAMAAQVRRPSRAAMKESTAETRQWIHGQRKTQLLDAWRQKVSGDEVKSCFRVLDRFGIDLYTADTSMPNHDSLGRVGFAASESSARQSIGHPT